MGQLIRIYEDDNWEIYERSGNLMITYNKDGFPTTIALTPEIMKSKLMDILKDLPYDVWEVGKY